MSPIAPAFSEVAVLGAGTMGHALALVHALAGCRVRLFDVSRQSLESAVRLIDQAAATLVQGGASSQDDAVAAVARIVTVEDLAETVRNADLVVEAVVEDREVKRQVYEAVQAAAPAEAVVASNSSYLEVFPLMPEAMGSRAMIVHWYTPPYIVDLVDVVPGPATDLSQIERMRAFLAGIGKQPIVFKTFITGFIANRLQSALNNEILDLLEAGLVTAEDIDRSIIHGLAARMALQGAVMKMDYTGLDMMRRALANRTFTPAEPKERSPVLDDLLARGCTGVMGGGGFYDYGGRDAVDLFRERDRKLLAIKRTMHEVGPQVA